MAKVRRIDFSADEWLGGTVALSLAERGLYITACALMYSAAGPIPVDRLRAACRDHGHTVNAALQRLVKLGKLELADGLLSNKRVSNELQNAFKRSSKAFQSASKRWSKHRQKDHVSRKNNGLDGDSALLTSNARARVPSTIKEDSSSLRYEESSSRPSAGAGKARSASPDVLLEKGIKLLGHRKRGLLRQMRLRHGEERVSLALAAVERKHPAEPVAFFLACCEDRRSEGEPLILGRPPPNYGPKTPPPRPEDLWPRED